MLAQPVVMLQGNHQPVMNAIWPAAVQAAGHAGLWAAEHAVLRVAGHAVFQIAHWPGLLSVTQPAFCWQAQAAQEPLAASSSWVHVPAGATVEGLQATLNPYSACLAVSKRCVWQADCHHRNHLPCSHVVKTS